MKFNKFLILCSLVSTVGFVACKKESSGGSSSGNQQTLKNKISDTTIAYTRDIYLWYNQIPSSFNARSYEDPNAIMEAIRKYSVEPGFAEPVDRWSFAVKKEQWDQVSNGVAKDFGLNVFFKAQGDLRVRIVEPQSPAGLAGIKRGWRITKINSLTDITTSKAEEIVNAVYYSSNTSFTFLKPDGNSVDISLTAASYNSKSIYLDTVYNVGAKKVGYFLYNSFLGDSTTTVNGFQRIFNRFATENIDDIIVDLRYNGGGYVAFQNELANYLVPTAGNNGLMMSTSFNDKYASQFNEQVYFKKKGTLNLSRIFFIVSSGTASASELLINNLKPYFSNTYIIGPSTTNGKPVGYFGIPVADWYIFPVSFRNVNKNNQGNYFNGFTLDKVVTDGLDKDFGDVAENCLASVLRYIDGGSFRTAVGEEPIVISPIIESTNKKLKPKAFEGMVIPNPFK